MDCHRILLVYFLYRQSVDGVCLLGVFSIFTVYYVVIIFRPQRAKASGITEEMLEVHDEDIEEVRRDDNREDSSYQNNQLICDNKINQVVRLQVLEIPCHGYFKPHLMRRDIIAKFDYWERIIVGAVIFTFGFYTMINTLGSSTRVNMQKHT